MKGSFGSIEPIAEDVHGQAAADDEQVDEARTPQPRPKRQAQAEASS